MKANKMIAVLLLVAVVLSAALVLILPHQLDLHLGEDAASHAKKASTVLTDAVIREDTEFGGVEIMVPTADFTALGFAYGDSVDVTFSNGYALEDLPFYNGYYSQTGAMLLVGFEGNDHIKVAINNGDGMWGASGLSEGDTATVTLNTPAKYLDIQTARDIHYTDFRDDYESDAVFANFRAVATDGIRSNTLYRSASPCENKHNRAPYVDALLGEAGVSLILDLADTEEKIGTYMEAEDYNSPNFQTLYWTGKVIPVGLNMNYLSEEFRANVAGALVAMSEQPGPYLVHCTEGKDRTGFVCMLLEALCGASYQQIVDDYMLTYANYYGVTAAGDPDRYNIIVSDVFDPMLRAMVGDDSVDLTTVDLAASAEAYLTAGGMTADQIAALKANLM